MVSDLGNIVHIRDTTTRKANIWNLEAVLRELDQQNWKFTKITDLHERLIHEMRLIVAMCDMLSQFNFSIFFSEILKSIVNAPDILKSHLIDKPESIDSYLSHISLFIKNLRLLKETPFKDTLQIGSDRKKPPIQSTMAIVEEEENDSQDMDEDPQNEMVPEYNMPGDAMSFCTRAISRFELRLFGLGVSESLEKEVLGLIGKARSRERLSRMYEGWMPWI